jgi:hypothetical protein
MRLKKAGFSGLFRGKYLYLAFQRLFQPLHGFVEVVCGRDGELVVGLHIVVRDDVIDLAILCLLGFDDQFYHGESPDFSQGFRELPCAGPPDQFLGPVFYKMFIFGETGMGMQENIATWGP